MPKRDLKSPSERLICQKETYNHPHSLYLCGLWVFKKSCMNTFPVFSTQPLCMASYVLRSELRGYNPLFV